MQTLILSSTKGYGTALGVITYLFETGSLERAYYTQSTPYHQGTRYVFYSMSRLLSTDTSFPGRLTALELKTLGAPSCMICDSMVGSLFQHHRIDAVLVGADRVARNGDTANKVGTYNAAVLAARHGIPLLVVAPVSTLDLALADGAGIPIEHRPPLEACTARGALLPPVLDASGARAQATVLIAPELSAIAALVRAPRAADAPPSTPSQDSESRAPLGGPGEAAEELQQVYNPSFDVTPAALIAAIVTEKGVATKDDGADVYDLSSSPVAV
jgi:methylthioribose-1-phosphate isomerase